MRNRAYFRKQEYLKKKQKKLKAAHQHGFPGIYYDEEKDQVVPVDAQLMKKSVKKWASRKIRHTDDIPTRGKGYRKFYNVDNMLW